MSVATRQDAADTPKKASRSGRGRKYLVDDIATWCSWTTFNLDW